VADARASQLPHFSCSRASHASIVKPGTSTTTAPSGPGVARIMAARNRGAPMATTARIASTPSPPPSGTSTTSAHPPMPCGPSPRLRINLASVPALAASAPPAPPPSPLPCFPRPSPPPPLLSLMSLGVLGCGERRRAGIVAHSPAPRPSRRVASHTCPPSDSRAPTGNMRNSPATRRARHRMYAECSWFRRVRAWGTSCGSVGRRASARTRRVRRPGGGVDVTASTRGRGTGTMHARKAYDGDRWGRCGRRVCLARSFWRWARRRSGV
jgi:hypothetical protein